MDPLTTAAASGLQSRLDSLDMLANNLANSSTSGFKADREFYSTYFSPDLDSGVDPTVGASPVVEKNWTDFSQGTLLPTGNSTDLALSGPGFFAVNGPNGTLYTRNGGFRISPKGVLVTAEGYPVRLVDNQTLQTQSANPIEVAPDGGLVQDGLPLGQLELANFDDPSQLTKLPDGFFQTPGPQVTATPATSVQVAQGKLESSNTGPAEASARMISLLRHFEMLQHAIKIGADMNRQAVEEVAKVVS
ncbi:MAG: flagellar hook basal-body protein [Acidobacteriaceae bacterium]|nr:flagellar hook basal-body protein [Acidobacteriaceae bacterium]